MAHLVVRLLFAAAVVWTLWGYAPPGVERPAPDGDGFAARFAAPTRVKGADVPFFFGLATAPAHVEDGLDDGWLAFARSGGVAAWSNAPRPELRNAFWTRPEVELDLAASTGVQARRCAPGLRSSRPSASQRQLT